MAEPNGSRVHEALRRGEPLHFDPDDPNRVIPGEWISSLSTPANRQIRVPIEICGAVITGSVALQYTTFNCEVLFRDCEFEGAVDCSYATFCGEAEWTDCQIEGGLALRSTDVRYNLVLDHSMVTDPDFSGLRVRGTMRAVNAAFSGGRVSMDGLRARSISWVSTDIAARFSARKARVLLDASFDGTTFRHSADFTGLTVGGTLSFGSTDPAAEIGPATFIGSTNFSHACSTGPAAFYDVAFGGTAKFRGALFMNRADFDGAVFSDHVYFSYTRFRAAASFKGVRFESYVSFYGCTVRHDLIFEPQKHSPNPVEFQGRASFVKAVVQGESVFSGVRFCSQVDFNHFRSEGPAYFGPAGNQPVHFEGPVEFAWAHFGRYVNIRGAQFHASASLVRVYVQHNLALAPSSPAVPVACFHGPVDFTGATIGGDFDATGTDFLQEVDFSSVVISGTAQFGARGPDTPVVFAGKAVFHGANFRGDASFAQAVFKHQADFSATRAERLIEFAGAVFHRTARFSDAVFHEVHFRAAPGVDSEPSRERQFVVPPEVEGLNYSRISANWKELLSPVAHGSLRRDDGAVDARRFSRQPYNQLEKVVRASGDQKIADAVYLAGRKEEALHCRRENRVRFVLLKGYELLAGFGVRRTQLLLHTILVVLLGTLVFQLPHAAAEKHTGRDAEPLSEPLPLPAALGMSVYQFLPVQVPSGEQWEPTDSLISVRGYPTGVTYRAYASLHRLTGFILVPLGLAALAGLLHRKPLTLSSE
jgi:uncharacterized protein YjbI with pentapeptide repeats